MKTRYSVTRKTGFVTSWFVTDAEGRRSATHCLTESAALALIADWEKSDLNCAAIDYADRITKSARRLFNRGALTFGEYATFHQDAVREYKTAHA